jgi:cell division protein FtsI (penicillin-binding protein 3)
VIHAQSIKPEKKELFVKLFSIYSGIETKKILKKFKRKNGRLKKGFITLCKTLNEMRAQELKTLAYKLRQLKVFQPIEIKPGVKVLYGLDVVEVGENRIYPLYDVLTPIVGYINKKYENRYTRPHGMKGLEGYYEKHILSKKNGYFQGKRDVGGNIIHNKNSINQIRVDGLNLHLNIPLSLQARIEKMLDAMKQRLDAEEILVGVMESQTGKLRSLATTQRYTPSSISQDEIAMLDPKFSEYTYELGSVIKPMVLSIALENGNVTPKTWIDTENGRMNIARFVIRDEHKHESLTATDVIVESSNIGIAKIVWKIPNEYFRRGLTKFGLGEPSGIDLSIDNSGRLFSLKKLKNRVNKASNAYGYGMLVTFTQLLKAYSAFNNNGVAVTPRIVDYLTDTDHKTYVPKLHMGSKRATSFKVAQTMNGILQEAVARGTGKGAQYPGLTIGGKTGTARIVESGKYSENYHSSFFGFANDNKGKKYTIGVLVIRAKKPYKYYAAQSAVPTFKNIVHILVNQGYLSPSVKDETLKTLDAELYRVKREEKVVATPTLKAEPNKVEKKVQKKVKEKDTQIVKKPLKNKEIKELFKTL